MFRLGRMIRSEMVDFYISEPRPVSQRQRQTCPQTGFCVWIYTSASGGSSESVYGINQNIPVMVAACVIAPRTLIGTGGLIHGEQLPGR